MKYRFNNNPFIRYPCFNLIVLMFAITQTLHADTVGSAVYEQGKTSTGTVVINKNKAPSTLFPCINCHLTRGTGSKEGGIVAPDISWNQLTQPFQKGVKGVRNRTPYRFDSFKNALLSGINTDGKSLSDNMPRYLLSNAEIHSLISYLQQIDKLPQRGIENSKIHFWLRLPENPELADVLRDTVSVFVDEINKQGGIYRRQLILHEYTNEKASRLAFCILDLRMQYQQDQIPMNQKMIDINVFSPDHATDTSYSLYRHPATYPLLMADLAKEQGWNPMKLKNQDVNRVVKTLKGLTVAQISSTVLVHQAENMPIKLLIESLQMAQISPRILTNQKASSLNIEQLMTAYPAPIYIVMPPGLESLSEQGLRRLYKLIPSFKKSKHYLSARLWVLTLMNLLTTTLQQSGRELNEAKFIDVLQSQVELNTGFSPLLSYSAKQRIGNNGTILMQLN